MLTLKSYSAIFDTNNHKIDNYCPCIFINNSAFSTSIFTNSDLFESLEPNSYIYKISYDSDIYIQRYSCSTIIMNFWILW